jgi:hypothetical protein
LASSHHPGASSIVYDDAVTPFWRRMPQLFRFPAYRRPLLRNLGLSLGFAVALAIHARLAVVVAFLASFYLAYYGFQVIERVAQGYLHPDHFPVSRAGLWRPLKLVVILTVAFVPVAVMTVLFGEGVVTMLVNVAVALLLPASVMTLAITDSLGQAVSPRRTYELARKIGPSYLVLFLFLLLLMGGSPQAFELVAPALGSSNWLLAFASSFVGNYFFLIMCALMGYVLFQYSDVLGLPVVGRGEDELTEPSSGIVDAESAWRETTLGRLVASGDLQGAIALLERAERGHPDDLALHARLHKLLQIDGARARIDAHLDRFLEVALARDPPQAVALAREALARDVDWTPSSATQAARLARAALDMQQFDLVMVLTRDFEARYPTHGSASTVAAMRSQAASALSVSGGLRADRMSASKGPAAR